jgi:hypothetical protein
VGLDITVGYLADLAENDPEFIEEVRKDFALANRVLAEKGLPTWEEPERADWKPVSVDMIGYSGLHYLRRIAAHLAAGNGLPEPGDDDSSDDPLLEAYYKRAEGGRTRGLFDRRRLPEIDRRFDHLILHADNEGFYAPVDFADVIEVEVVGSALGSSHALLRECEELRGVLAIPDSVTYDSEELWEASDAQGEGDGWRRYGVESFTCVALQTVARASVEHGAAIVFH